MHNNRQKTRLLEILLISSLLFIGLFIGNIYALSGTGGTISVSSKMDAIVYTAANGQVYSNGSGGIIPVGEYRANNGNINGRFGTERSNDNNDTLPPNIILISPADDSGIRRRPITFEYNVTDDSILSKCEMYIDNIYSGIDNSPVNGKNGFIISNLNYSIHNWYISCEDELGHSSNSSIRQFEFFIMNKFNDETTDLSIVNLSSVPNLTLSISGIGRIRFRDNTNVRNIDFDNNIKISDKSIIINSSAIPQLNKAAILTLYNLPFENIVIWKDGEVCSSCTIISNNGGTLEFEVTGFSNYTITSSSSLVIYDDTDTISRLSNESVKFTANYTNITSGESINGNCEISFDINGWNVPQNMNYNLSSKIYLYNRSFNDSGQKNYRVNCTPLEEGFDNLAALDNVFISGISLQGFASLNITSLNSSRFNDSYEPKNIESRSGNVSRMDITALQNTNAWQGYFGNISSKIILANGLGKTLYDWTNISATGEILASRSSNVDWSSIACANSNGIDSENAFLEKTSSSADSVANTFPLTGHPSFAVISKPISNCPSTKLHGPLGVEDNNFWNVMLGDNNGEGNIVYTNILKDNSPGFANKSVDFELIVASKRFQTTPYYFYMEIG